MPISNQEQRVIQLVGIREEDKVLYLTEEGKQFLESINAPICVVTVAGLYRTGKSFLVNQLLNKLKIQGKQTLDTQDNSTKQRFTVGSTVQSCTKGLNVWGVPFQSSSSGESFYYIVVDSEGIGSMQQQVNYDINLLMLIFLISSTVIYNSIGAIDQQSLDQLRVIVNLKKSLQTNLNTQPRLVWVLRDFALQLVNKRGQSMTPNQYLQQCLQQVNSLSKQVIKKNQIRSAISSSLPNRECHTLVRPTINQQQLATLQQMPKGKLRQQFVEQVDILFQSVFSHKQTDIKYLNDQKVDGPMLVKMIEYFVNEINCSRVPQVTSVWQLIQASRLEEVVEECQNQLKTQILKISLPLAEITLKERLNQIYNRTLSNFEKQIPQDIKTYKHFHNHFLKLTTKLNSKVQKANNQTKTKKILKTVRDTINKEIQFDKIDPCSLGEIKQVIQGLNLKDIGVCEVYEYVMSTVFDVMEICQQKSRKLRGQLYEWQQNGKQVDMQHKVKQQEITKLKQNYHESLKQISVLKSSQIDSQRDLAILRQQVNLLQGKQFTLHKQKTQKQQQMRRKIQQLNQKLRRRNQQANQSMKSLRQQNQSLITQLQESKKQLSERRNQERKQMIFQEKIKHSWDRFQQERVYFKKELTKFKELYYQAEEKNRTLLQKEEKLEVLLRKQREGFVKKEREFCQQLKWMKDNYSKTKDAYNQSNNTRIESQRILQDVTANSRRKNINLIGGNTTQMANTQIAGNNQMGVNNENISHHSAIEQSRSKSYVINNNNHSKISTMQTNSKVTLTTENKPKQPTNDKIAVMNEELTSVCQQLRKQKQSLLKQIQALKSVIQKLQLQLTEVKCSYEQKVDTLQQKMKMLQGSNQEEKDRFYSSLKELEHSKQAERQMYQESIMRLLNNIEGGEINKLRAINSIDKGLTPHKTAKKHYY